MNAHYVGGAIALLLAVSACGTDTTPPTPAPAPASLAGTVTVAGGYAVHGDFSTAPAVLRGALPTAAPAGYTCADYAHGELDSASGASTFVSPQMQTAGASSVFVQVILASGYRGPATYDSTTTPALTGVAAITIPPASAPVIDDFRSAFYGSVRLTVRPDGSGSVTITHWGSPGSDSRISGSATWSCMAAGSPFGRNVRVTRHELGTPAARGATNPRDRARQPLSVGSCERRDGRAPNEMAGRLAPCTWRLASLLGRRDRRASGAW
jgi:hypothetical protein